jgi:hypothetical protein
MSLTPTRAMTEKSFCAQPPITALGSAQGAGYGSVEGKPGRGVPRLSPCRPFRLARPFRAGTCQWMCLLTRADEAVKKCL